MATKNVKSTNQPRKNKAGAGRPTVMTPEVLRLLKEAFLLGCSDNEACFNAGITKATLYNYQQEHPEYVDQKEMWKDRPILLARTAIINQIEKGDGELALKYAERKKKDEFSTKSDVGLGVSDELKEALDKVSQLFPN